eukprot:126293_1
MALFDKTCAAIGRYYASLNKEYDNLFSEYCDLNGVEDMDELREHLEDAPQECLLIDFDENFPFKVEPAGPTARAEFIHGLIQRCIDNPDIQFGSNARIPDFYTFGSKLFQLDRKSLDSIAAIYEAQCPAFYEHNWTQDNAFINILAIGKKYQFDYLLHLV